MPSIPRVVRSPWLWIFVAVIVALTSRDLAAAIFLLAYAFLMLGSARFYRQKWLRTGEIQVRRYNLRRRWSAVAFVGTLVMLAVIAIILAIAALIAAFS